MKCKLFAVSRALLLVLWYTEQEVIHGEGEKFYEKILAMLLCFCVSLVVLTGCGGGETVKDVELSTLTSTMERQQKGTFEKLTIRDLKMEYDIDSGDVKQFIAEKSENGVFLLLEATSKDAAERIQKKLNRDEAQKVSHGNYIGFFVGTGSDKMAQTFEDVLTVES